MTIFDKVRAIKKYTLRILRNEKTYFKDTGWLDSIVKKVPVDREGDPVPFLPYPLVYILKERLTKNFKVFEYGAGYSTLFYERYVGEVHAVEHQKKWLDILSEYSSGKASLIYHSLSEEDSYEKSCLEKGIKYDLIIIDGRKRNECIKYAIQSLTEQGVIILDDSEREKYNNGIDILISSGFKKLDISGLSASAWENHQSSIFYKINNLLGI